MVTQDVLAGVDLTSIGGIAAVAYLLVGALKRAWPVWVAGKEEVIAIGGALAIGFVMKKWCGSFVDVAWGSHVMQLLASGIFAQLIHDKVMNPLIKASQPSGPPPAP